MEFLKVSGAGNDFIALPEPESPPSRRQIRAWCRRGLSVGADGLFLLERRDDAVRMTYFNADGGEAELCLNGARCAVRVALELDWVTGDVRLETGAGSLTGRDAEHGRIAVDAPLPGAPVREIEVETDGQRLTIAAVTIGVPHWIVAWPEGLATAPVQDLGAVLRAHPSAGEAGANVSFVRFPTPHAMEIRTFERGVEAETLACGTGVLAAAAAGLATGSARLPLEALTAGGFRLQIEGRSQAGEPSIWSLIGDARIVARGSLTPGASEFPAAAVWSS
ncbi:MAG: diaminopimelate epimerase [Acidobacteriota bacterium]